MNTGPKSVASPIARGGRLHERVNREEETAPVWILFLEVEGAEPNGEPMGAYTYVAVVAPRVEQAIELAQHYLGQSGFSIANVESASEFRRLPLARRRLSRLRAPADRARRSGGAHWTPFYSWTGDSED